MEEKINDEKLVDDYLQGNDVAFEKLLERYLKPIYNFLFRLTNDQAAAEDLSQDTFLRAWKNLRRFDPDKKFKTWLFVIAKNAAFDWMKKKKSLPFSHFADEEGNNALENFSEKKPLPDEILARKDLAQELEEKLAGIPEYYRAILLMHYKEDFSLQEISEILGESYNTVKSRHRRALIELRKILIN
jgi:RNA polymerase sigma-70 factor, ECF subfamily